MNTAPLLRVHALSGTRSEHVLFQSLSFTLAPNTVLQISGENGAGKTTLLRILAGLLPESAGEIHWNTDYLYCGHRLGLQPNLTIEENLEHYQHLSQSSQNIVPALKTLDLYALRKKNVSTLSAGQQKRVQLARLLLEFRSVWILDEPFTALDSHAKQWLTQHITEHCRQQGAVIITSHQPFESEHCHIQSLHLSQVSA